MFGGHVSARDGKSDLEQPGIITPIVLFMAMTKDGSGSVGWCPDLWCCSEKPGSHTQIYVCTCIPSGLNLLLKFIYVTGWLDPTSCVYIFINKMLPVPLLPFSLCLHKLKPCLVEYIIVLVSFGDRSIFCLQMSPCSQVIPLAVIIHVCKCDLETRCNPMSSCRPLFYICIWDRAYPYFL